MPDFTYAFSVSQEPVTSTLSSLATAGAGIWKRTLEAGSPGTFSVPPPDVVVPPLSPFSSPPPPVVPPVLAVFDLSSPELAYQTPPPMISAIATTAAAMIATGELILR